MDWDLIIIFAFILLAASLVLSAAQMFHRRAVQHEERKLELKLEIERAKASQNSAGEERQAHVEDRLRVLERIVTDQTDNLSNQIESLRDSRMEAR